MWHKRGLGLIYTVLIAAVLCSLDVSAAERTLVFPTDTRVGTLILCDPPRRTNGFIDTNAADWVSHAAIGRITVPDDRYVVVEFGSTVSDPAVRGRISLEGIHSIWLAGEITKEMVCWLASSSTLIELRLLDAKFSADAFDDSPEMPKLAILSVDAEDKKQASGGGFARWCSKMPGLEYLYVRPALNSAEFVELDGHPSLAFINVEVSDQRASPFEVLARLPALRGLNLSVAKGTAFEALAGLDGLSQLHVINWNQGHVDGRVIDQLSKIRSLRQLRLHEVSLGSEFAERIAALDKLEELGVQASNWDESTPILEKLPQALFQMPRLRSWPTLRQVDLETLKRISGCEWIDRLAIEGVEKSVTASDVARWDVSRLTRLKYLELSYVPVDDAWLKQLSGAQQLQMLELDGTRVTGKGLEALKDLPKLERLELGFEQGFETALEGLAKCRFIKRLQIYGELPPRQFDPLKNCPQLEELVIGEGVADDVTAEWLSRMSSLKELDLGESCYMTDRGAALLSRLPSLQYLSIGGTITSEGVASLAKTPLLTRLQVHSTQLSDDDADRLKRLAPTLSHFEVSEYRGQKERIEQLLLKGR